MSRPDVLPGDFDMDLAATINRMQAEYGPASFDAACDFLIADAEFAAILREQDEAARARQARYAAADAGFDPAAAAHTAQAVDFVCDALFGARSAA